jgi:hypothetical protein
MFAEKIRRDFNMEALCEMTRLIFPNVEYDTFCDINQCNVFKVHVLCLIGRKKIVVILSTPITGHTEGCADVAFLVPQMHVAESIFHLLVEIMSSPNSTQQPRRNAQIT